MGLTIQYEWIPGGDACARCTSMQVLTTFRPRRPHPHCDCIILAGPDFCDRDKQETREQKEGTHEDELGIVPKGGSTTISVTDTISSSDKWNIGFENGGIESEEGESTSTSKSTTFNHSGETDEAEVVVGTYEDFKIDKLEHEDCLLNDFWQTRTSYESRLVDVVQVPASERR